MKSFNVGYLITLKGTWNVAFPIFMMWCTGTPKNGRNAAVHANKELKAT